MKRLKKWWFAERKGRFEEGTSQDMFPTNGHVVMWIVCWIIVWGIMILAFHN